ncbi:MAG: hypothetical protein ACLPXB_14655 [Thiobacillaceae bacterium]|jgi:hypothetical protein
MHLIIPHLFPSPEFLQAALQDLRLPSLETLIARGRVSTSVVAGVEGALCLAWGIKRQTDWPWAPASLLADGGVPERAYWLRCDPVHIRVQRNRLIVLGNESISVTQEEATTLCNDLAGHFGATFQPQAVHPNRWYCCPTDDPIIETTPLSLVIGRDIDPLLPRGPGALKWRALLNEVQMLLYGHPVNQAREAHNLPAINSIWLWGGGRFSQAASVSGRFFCTDNHLRSIAKGIGIGAPPWTGKFEEVVSDGVALLAQLEIDGQRGDVLGWREAARQFDAQLLSLLVKSGTPLKLEDPISGTVLHYAPKDRWKLWRRAKPLAPKAQMVSITPPSSAPAVDEFGNTLRKISYGMS